jgi:hypothetical protein
LQTRLAILYEDLAHNGCAGLFHRESIFGNCLLQLLQRRGIPELHFHYGKSSFEAHIDRINASYGFQGHAHGVCTDFSIHAEDGQFDGPDFCLCGRCK